MTTEIDDGGPAFPQSDLSAYGMGPVDGNNSGLSMRDYFAAHAMRARWGNGQAMTAEDAAQMAYQLADAMIEARKGKCNDASE